MKYIRCDFCGEKIYFGSECYENSGFCAKYCSKECYAQENADICIIDEETAENSQCEVFDDEDDAIKILKIKKQIIELEKELKILEKEQPNDN